MLLSPFTGEETEALRSNLVLALEYMSGHHRMCSSKDGGILSLRQPRFSVCRHLPGPDQELLGASSVPWLSGGSVHSALLRGLYFPWTLAPLGLELESILHGDLHVGFTLFLN